MQEVIEDAVRGVGYLTLRAVTLGRYRGGTAESRVPEGAIGLALIAAALYVTYLIAE